VLAPLTPPSITGFTVIPDGVVVTWSTVQGYTYLLERSALGDGNWESIQPPLTATGPSLSLTNGCPGLDRQFFRVQALP